jgi:predicted Zn-dependent protease
MTRAGWRHAVCAAILALLAACATMDQMSKVAQGQLEQRGLGTIAHGLQAGGLVLRSFADITPDQEHYIGRSVCAQLLANPRFALAKSPRLESYVADVGQAIALGAPSVSAPYQGYRFAILDAKSVNAFSTPGGYVFVTRGALAAAHDEDELAALLAHEIAHVQLRHGLSAIKQSNLTEAGKIAGGEALARGNPQLAQAFGASVLDVVGTIVTNGYGRSQEAEADALAARLLAEAGYSPRSLVDLLRRENPDGGGFRSDHPSAADRVKLLEGIVPALGAAGAGAEVRAARYQKATRGAV